MSYPTYTAEVRKTDKPLLWLHVEVKTPPFSSAARIEAGVLLRRLQRGETIALPHSRPMPDAVMESSRKRLRNCLVAVCDKETKR